MTRLHKATWTSVAAMASLLWSLSASASALHAFCVTPTPSCSDNGTITPTGASDPNFGFWYGSGPTTGDYQIAILVPNTVMLPSGYSIAITGTQGGPGNNQSISATATEVGAGWNGGFLGPYLGLTGATPANPLGAWLPSTQGVDAGASGYYVFEANLGKTTLQDQGGAMSGPLLNAGTLDLGTVVVGFLGVEHCKKNTSCTTKWIATANSGALFEAGSSVPEPGTLALFAAGLAGLVLLATGRKRRRA